MLASLGGTLSDGTAWSLSFEGLSIGWALLGFALLAAGTIYAYLRLTPVQPAWRCYAMIALRLAILGVFLLLLIKPVLNLTLGHTVRQTLLVAVDASQSMAVQDKRERPEDLARAAIAAGVVSPARGLGQPLPSGAPAGLATISRHEVLLRLAANEDLNLWPRLAAEADLEFHKFGRAATGLPGGTNITGLPGGTNITGLPGGTNINGLSILEAVRIFESATPDQSATGIGDSLREILQSGRTRPAAGLLLVTDGQSNIGSSALDAARAARDQAIPLFIYGVGVTSPPDLIVDEIATRKLAFVDERVQVRARIRSRGIEGKTVTARLRVDGIDQDERTAEISGDGEQTIYLYFVAREPGDARAELAVDTLPEEATHENNRASARLRVTDEKFHVLVIEQEPRWDFRYLLAYLQRDRRLEVRCVVIDGEPGLDAGADSVFLPGLPSDREDFFKSEVIILGDVNPSDLGEERMEIIRDWVQAGGGIIFLAGPKFDPLAYAETPLAALLPVVPDSSVSPQVAGQRLRQPFKLQLTALGETSPYLRIASDPEENKILWESFPGVRWTARTLRAKPGAEVLIVDPRPDMENRYGPPPVFAMQRYGAGTAVYLGTDETYRWRSGVGEKYYSLLWGQIMQSLALELLEGGSARTQLKSDRRQYLTGEKAVITARAYEDGFRPLVSRTLYGTLTISETAPDGTPRERVEPLALSATEDGGFRAELEVQTPGDYTFTSARDPETVLRFEVVEPRIEHTETALNERLLQSMAAMTGGRFLREEDLHELPDLIQEKRATVTSFQSKALYHSAWWFALLVCLVTAEWIIRRISQLK